MIYFHVSDDDLSPGTVLKTGNWVRKKLCPVPALIDTSREALRDFQWYVTELRFEAERKRVAPDAPSRLESVSGFDWLSTAFALISSAERRLLRLALFPVLPSRGSSGLMCTRTSFHSIEQVAHRGSWSLGVSGEVGRLYPCLALAASSRLGGFRFVP